MGTRQQDVSGSPWGSRSGSQQNVCVGACKQESSLYTDPKQPLGRFLPQMLRIAEGAHSGLRDAQGAIMAPCIVMEKGEALDVWIENSGETIDMFTGLQARCHNVVVPCFPKVC